MTDFKQYTPIPVYQPDFMEYQHYLASIQDNLSLSERGINTLVRWYENSKRVLE